MEAEFLFHETTKDAAWQHLKEALATNKPHRVIIKPWKSTRSLSQNALMWMWNDDIAAAINEISTERLSKDEMHEYLKELFCPIKTISVMGVARRVKSTKLLNTDEMNFYLRRIEVWCIDRGIKTRIPENSEYHKRRLDNE
ncbi:recombination protein NinB [Morganella morganii]|uniref:recombination protein NinB n=1 Tax=Morganella morganii TaxID=582 RepID=UPI001C8C58FF|nr:recombination protein NinB [Morganella morganii]ELN8404797.1 recombination protein NinB [Morganella morganii]MBX9344762.1 recombination protein NinB [Morganella morganii]MBX9367913.1 recombination protein NinB [Morganella morganii]HCR4000221.1 recombination protein NinB [Morganella morganii]HDU8431870.1 recombination protein NinB [Morganella morganii]